jgi:hypothetical protein
VRVHTNAQAAESAAAIFARAYTFEDSIVFGKGRYTPDTHSGRLLIAHELAHVVQQSKRAGQVKSESGMEEEAQQTALHALHGHSISISTATEKGIQRAPLTKQEIDQLNEEQLQGRLKRNEIEGHSYVLPADMLEQLSQENRYLKDAIIAKTQRGSTQVPPKWELPEDIVPGTYEEVSKEPLYIDNFTRWGYTPFSKEIILIFPGEAEISIPLARISAGVPQQQRPTEGRVVALAVFQRNPQSGIVYPVTGYSRSLTPKIVALAQEQAEYFADQDFWLSLGMSLFSWGSPPEEVGNTALGVNTAITVLRLFSLRRRGPTGPRVQAPATQQRIRTPQQAAQEYMNRAPGRIVNNNNALEGIFTRVRNETNRVDARAAAHELRIIDQVLKEGFEGKVVSRIEVVPSSSAGRTPDFVGHFADGTSARIEARAITSAPRGNVVPKTDGGLGATARSLAEATNRANVRMGSQTAVQTAIEQAILSKAKVTPTRPSQLTAPMAGVNPGGTIWVNVAAAQVEVATIEAAIQRVAPRLGAHVEQVKVSYLQERFAVTDPLQRGTLTYVRRNNSYVKTATSQAPPRTGITPAPDPNGSWLRLEGENVRPARAGTRIPMGTENQPTPPVPRIENLPEQPSEGERVRVQAWTDEEIKSMQELESLADEFERRANLRGRRSR